MVRVSFINWLTLNSSKWILRSFSSSIDCKRLFSSTTLEKSSGKVSPVKEIVNHSKNAIHFVISLTALWPEWDGKWVLNVLERRWGKKWILAKSVFHYQVEIAFPTNHFVNIEMKVVNTGLNHCAGKVINIFLKSQAIVHCKMKMHFTTSASCISQYYSDPNLNSAFSKTKFEQFLNTIFYKNQLSLSKLVKIAKFTFSDFTICQIQNLHNFGSQNFTWKLKKFVPQIW